MSLIVMTQTIETDGVYFLANRQYEYEFTTYDVTKVVGSYIPDFGTVALHYAVRRDGKLHNVPACVCCEYDVVIPVLAQNKAAYDEYIKTDHTSDWQTAWRNLTGNIINNNAGADIDLRAYNALVEEHPSIVPDENILP